MSEMSTKIANSYEYIQLEVDGGISLVTINRLKQLNALNTEVLKELEQAFDAISQDKNIAVVIVTGAGEKSFVAGADIAEMHKKNAQEGTDFSEFGNSVMSKLANLPQPSIAAVNGYALGGGNELALACDIRIAAENAKFGQPEVGLGIIPGFGGTQRLARLVGPAKAKELIFTGQTISAEEAYTIGLVNKVVEKGQALEAAEEMARAIMKNAPLAIEASKKAIDLGLEGSLEQGIKIEESLFGQLFDTTDQKEGMEAFIEKRQANFHRQ